MEEFRFYQKQAKHFPLLSGLWTECPHKKDMIMFHREVFLRSNRLFKGRTACPPMEGWRRARGDTGKTAGVSSDTAAQVAKDSIAISKDMTFSQIFHE